MLVYKGTLHDKVSKWGLSFSTEHTLEGEHRHAVHAIHACADPYMVFLYGRWDELWLADLDIMEQRGSVVSGMHIKFLKQLGFDDCLMFTKDTAMLAYYWVINFSETISTEEIEHILPYVLTNEECVISWAENINTHIPLLKDHIVTPRYAYLWKLEGFPTDDRLDRLAGEYTRMARTKWSAR